MWTKRTGNNHDAGLVVQHCGPAATHEYRVSTDSSQLAAAIEYYYFDQMGPVHSSAPDATSWWSIECFVDEGVRVRFGRERGPRGTF